MLLNGLFQNTNYDDVQFSCDEQRGLEERITLKKARGKDVPYIICTIRDKEVELMPEKQSVKCIRGMESDE